MPAAARPTGSSRRSPAPRLVPARERKALRRLRAILEENRDRGARATVAGAETYGPHAADEPRPSAPRPRPLPGSRSSRGLAAPAAATRRRSPPTAETEGLYIDVGELNYQVQISRQLNPADAEDSDYLTGLPAGRPAAGAEEVWFGVFIRVENETDGRRHRGARVRDRRLRRRSLHAGPARPGRQPVRLRARARSRPGELDPGPDSPPPTARSRATLLLFKLDRRRRYQNRPLELRSRRRRGPAATATDRPRRLGAAGASLAAPPRSTGRAAGAARLAARSLADQQRRATATRAGAAGAKATNQASVSVVSPAGAAGAGSVGAGLVGAGVAQLRRAGLARDLARPGSAAATPVPDVHHGTHVAARPCARRARDVARRARGCAPLRSVGAAGARARRSPRRRVAISQRGRQHARPGRSRVEPTARSSPISSAAGMRRARGADEAGRRR